MIKKISMFTMIASTVIVFTSIWGYAVEIEDVKKVFWILLFVPASLVLIAGWAYIKPLSVNKNIYWIVGSLVLIIIGIGCIVYFFGDQNSLFPNWLVRFLSYIFLYIGALSVYTRNLAE